MKRKATSSKTENEEKKKKVKFEKPLKSKFNELNNKATNKNRKVKTVKFEKSVHAKENKDIPTDKNEKKSILKKNAIGKDNEEKKHNAVSEKPDWNKLKKEKRELKKTRKAKKLNDNKLHNIIIQAKQIGEKLRRSDCTSEDRIKLSQTLHDRLKGLYSKLILTHDMSRIIQCLIKHCEHDTRQAIFSEIKSSILEILQSKYAKNCVKTVLKYGSQEMRSEIISTFQGNIIKLISHSISAPLVELAYSTWCNNLEKAYFKQEFYGDMYKQAKDKTVKTLTDVYATAEDMKSATLSAVKANLVRILNKGFVDSTLLHTILWEFFCVCSAEDKGELIVMLRSSIVTLSQTKMGAKVVAQCIWHGNNKDRKIIVKAFKENVKAICMSEHGYMTLLALFDSMDDTVIVKKIILAELKMNLVEIALNEYGKHIILYLVARRDSHYFPPSVVEYLRQGDSNLTSKKPADLREKELLEAISDSFLQAVAADAATWLSNSVIAMVTLAILKVGSGEKLSIAFESIAKYFCNTNSKIVQNGTECNAIEHSGLHMMLKKLIQNDKELLKKDKSTFGEILISQLTEEVLKEWIKFNRGCFLLVLLVENEAENVVSSLFSKLDPLVKELKAQKSSGAIILLKKFKQQ